MKFKAILSETITYWRLFFRAIKQCICRIWEITKRYYSACYLYLHPKEFKDSRIPEDADTSSSDDDSDAT